MKASCCETAIWILRKRYFSLFSSRRRLASIRGRVSTIGSSSGRALIRARASALRSVVTEAPCQQAIRHRKTAGKSRTLHSYSLEQAPRIFRPFLIQLHDGRLAVCVEHSIPDSLYADDALFRVND